MQKTKLKLVHTYETALMAAQILGRSGFHAYIIGGAVRDICLGLNPKDFDLVTNATPEQIMNIPEFRHSNYKDPAQAFGVTRVRFYNRGIVNELEIATFRKDIEAHKGRKATKIQFTDLEEDVERRDFTINALALDTETGFIIDYVGGIDDLIAKKIKFIGKPGDRIIEDPLRLMRAIRIKNNLGFDYLPATKKAIQEATKLGLAETIAIDRLRDEINRMLVHPSRRSSLYDLNSFGILERILPEVTAGIGVQQPPQFHAEGDVWQHELLIMDYLPSNPSRRLAWAALLHDIGKVPTSRKPRNNEGRIRFDRHYAVGAEMAKTILRRLNFSNKDIREITWMIYYHMAIDDLPNMRPSHQQRMMGHPAFADLLELHKADAAASWRPKESHGIKPKFKEIEDVWAKYQAQEPAKQQPSLKRDLGIDGNWLTKNFGDELKHRDGKAIGKVLETLDEAYRDEGITDEEFYFEKAKELIKQFSR
ncbi:MAG: CCA tRNA nucleotidyltransferase [Candidatus Saccharimonadales bacterium]